jgi:hypothetical protein
MRLFSGVVGGFWRRPGKIDLQSVQSGSTAINATIRKSIDEVQTPATWLVASALDMERGIEGGSIVDIDKADRIVVPRCRMQFEANPGGGSGVFADIGKQLFNHQLHACRQFWRLPRQLCGHPVLQCRQGSGIRSYGKFRRMFSHVVSIEERS